MGTRVTRDHLDKVARRINILTGQPLMRYTAPTAALVRDSYEPNPGHYYIDCAYDGYQLRQYSKHKGDRDVLMCGHILARELINQMYAYIQGIQDATSYSKGEL